MVRYSVKLRDRYPEILTEEELSEYLHFFTKEEIDSIVELHYRG